MSIYVICIEPEPILETWPPIYRGQEGTVEGSGDGLERVREAGEELAWKEREERRREGDVEG
jgi:hypothetical protein